MKRGDCGSSSRTSRSWRIATLRTASPIKVPGQTALRSSSFVTSWPGRPTRWSSTAKALGRSFISCEPFHRHSLAKSRQKGSKTIRFPFATLVSQKVTETLRRVYDLQRPGHYCLLLMSGWQHRAAFVVQFRPETNIDAGRFEGRVEHVATNRAIRFHSLDELLGFIARVLTE